MKKRNLFKFASFLGTILLAAFILQACNSKPGQLAQGELEGYWVLKSLNGKPAKDQFAGAIPTLEFNFNDSTIFGTSGCNRYTGSFSYSDGFLKAPNLASTAMLCTEDNAEPQYLEALSSVNNIPTIVDGVLTITHDGVVALEFERGTPESVTQPVEVNPTTLQGEWILKSIDGNEIKGDSEAAPSLSFNFQDSKVSGSTGCNRYNGTFSLSGSQLVVGPVMTTRMACDNMAAEKAFTQAIADTTSLSLPNENILQFDKKGIVLLVFEKVKIENQSSK